MNRKDYEKKLTGELTKIHGSKKNYKKNSEDIYQYIENLEGTAINNADKLKKEHEILGKKWADKEPSTTVHELIQRINGLTV